MNLNQCCPTQLNAGRFLRLIAMGLAGGSAVISETARTERPSRLYEDFPLQWDGNARSLPGQGCGNQE